MLQLRPKVMPHFCFQWRIKSFYNKINLIIDSCSTHVVCVHEHTRANYEMQSDREQLTCKKRVKNCSILHTLTHAFASILSKHPYVMQYSIAHVRTLSSMGLFTKHHSRRSIALICSCRADQISFTFCLSACFKCNKYCFVKNNK